MADTVVLSQGDPTVVLNADGVPTIIASPDVEAVIVGQDGPLIQIFNGEPAVTDLLAQYILLSR
jgi:hypothetical protein